MLRSECRQPDSVAQESMDSAWIFWDNPDFGICLCRRDQVRDNTALCL